MTDAADASVGVVRRGYDALGERYHRWSHEGQLRLRFVHQLLDLVPAGSRVLDLGCGPGDPGTRLLSSRFRVVGVDLSLVQLRLAQKAAPTASFVAADMSRLGLRRGGIDAVASFYAFGHLPGTLHRGVIDDIANWLVPDGLLLANAPLDTADMEEEFLGVPMFFGGIGTAATLSALADAGLYVEWSEEITEDEGGGHLATFLWLVARKASA